MRLFFSSLILISIFTLQVSAGAFDTVVIDAGHGGQRFDIMYADVLKAPTASMKDMIASSLKAMVVRMREK